MEIAGCDPCWYLDAISLASFGVRPRFCKKNTSRIPKSHGVYYPPEHLPQLRFCCSELYNVYLCYLITIFDIVNLNIENNKHIPDCELLNKIYFNVRNFGRRWCQTCCSSATRIRQKFNIIIPTL